MCQIFLALISFTILAFFLLLLSLDLASDWFTRVLSRFAVAKNFLLFPKKLKMTLVG